MLFKYLIICLWLFKLAICERSFTIVLDTTTSMQEELDVIKVNLPVALESVSKDIKEFILVPFNDPDLAEEIATQNPADLIAAVNRMTAYGGHKCPENSLAGIERALQISKPRSNIFMFTDAYSKDGNRLNAIQNLCRNTRSQVVIFLTGYCLPSPTLPTANVQVYYDVVKACSGTLFQLDTRDLRQVFKYIKEVINVEWTEVTSYDAFKDYKEISFTVDSFTKSVLLSVSSKDSPTVVISPVLNSSSVMENLVDFKHIQIIRLMEASPGEYKVSIRCSGTTFVILYKQSQLPLQIGFSTEKPRSIKETSPRPIPGRENYLLIEVSSKIKIETIEIEVLDEKVKTTLAIEETLNDDIYLTKVFIEPNKSFRIWIHGYDKVTTQKISASTETVIPQESKGVDTRWTIPKAEILDGSTLTVDFGAKTTLACKVVGYPKPSVWWEDDSGVTLTTWTDGVLLEIPSLYISYIHIENVTVNSTIYCKCKNAEGEDSQSIKVYVYRPYTFEVLQTPEDQTIEYHSEGKLFCQVSAYPEAEIKWYHNDTLVTSSEDVEIIPEDNALVLRRMTLNNVGEYTCESSNEANIKTYTAYVTISGLEAPQVEAENSDLTLKLGNWTYLECRVIKGTPTPAISWQFKPKNSEDFDTIPESVVEDDGKLKITAANNEHNGVFRCRAANIQGEHTAEISVVVQSPPIISNSDASTMSVKEGDDVALPCVVTASPKPTVYWEMTQDDVLLPLDDRHHTDDHNTHRFKALWKDSGNYHCVATNDIGRAEKTITVNVLVKPYIEPPRLKTVTVRAGGYVTLECNVTYGNPAPSTKWEFIARDSATRILKRSNSSSVLHVNKVRFADEGSYMCIAENDVGTDSINIYLKVQ